MNGPVPVKLPLMTFALETLLLTLNVNVFAPTSRAPEIASFWDPKFVTVKLEVPPSVIAEEIVFVAVPAVLMVKDVAAPELAPWKTSVF